MPLRNRSAIAFFPDFDNLDKLNAILEALPGSVDLSWECDTSPCVSYQDLEIWVDYSNPGKREDPDGGEIDIWAISEADNAARRVYQTDSLLTAIEVVRDWTDSRRPGQRSIDIFLPELESAFDTAG